MPGIINSTTLAHRQHDESRDVQEPPDIRYQRIQLAEFSRVTHHFLRLSKNRISH
jgi:hypothetical protein